MQHQIRDATTGEFSFRRIQQSVCHPAPSMLGLDEEIEHITAAILQRVRRVRWPVDDHEADARDRLVFEHCDEPEVGAVGQAGSQPPPKWRGHGGARHIRAPGITKHLVAMAADQLQVVGLDRSTLEHSVTVPWWGSIPESDSHPSIVVAPRPDPTKSFCFAAHISGSL